MIWITQNGIVDDEQLAQAWDGMSLKEKLSYAKQIGRGDDCGAIYTNWKYVQIRTKRKLVTLFAKGHHDSL